MTKARRASARKQRAVDRIVVLYLITLPLSISAGILLAMFVNKWLVLIVVVLWAVVYGYLLPRWFKRL